MHPFAWKMIPLGPARNYTSLNWRAVLPTKNREGPQIVQSGSDLEVTGVSSITITDEKGKSASKTGLDASKTYTAPSGDASRIASDGDDKTSIVGASIDSKVYTGDPLKPTVKLKATTLKEGFDYAITYKNSRGQAINPNDVVAAGNYQVTIDGKGEYTGIATATFTIKPANLSALTISTGTYNGKAQVPVVKLGKVALKTGVDFSISYKNAKKKAVAAKNVKAAGRYTATITGKGNYSGTVTKPFVINKAGNTIKASAKKKIVSLKAKDLRAKKKTVSNIKVAKAKGKVTYKNVSKKKSAKKFKVDKKGKVTASKGTRPGTYAIKIKISAKGGSNYKPGSKTVAFKIKVK